MKKWILSIVVCATITLPAMAQQVEGNNQLLSSGDLYQGMSRSIPNGRVVLPYGLEVTFEKTVHLIFPAAIRYVDLGSQNIIAGKADDAENVLRVKAAVICEDGSFYAFNVKYADEPGKLSMEMKDFLSPTEGRLPSNRADIYFKELGSESPILVKLIMKSIYQNDKRTIKHVGAKQFGMRFLLRGLYAHNGLLYFHVRMDNESNMPYAVDFITFKVVDKKVTHGKNFVLLSATLNGFARPSMVAMLEHFMGNGPIAAWEPIYTGDHSFQMIPLVETAERETVTVTGNLCTGTDLVLSDADMPKMEVGDTVVFPNAGSYAAVISPMQFASQPKPAQLFLRADGTVVNTDF